MKNTNEKTTHFIRNAIDISVANTGYPITGQVLTSAGIATRKQLRKMERQGLIKSVKIQVVEGNQKGQLFNAYFTEREVPKTFLEQQGLAPLEEVKESEAPVNEK